MFKLFDLTKEILLTSLTYALKFVYFLACNGLILANNFFSLILFILGAGYDVYSTMYKVGLIF